MTEYQSSVLFASSAPSSGASSSSRPQFVTAGDVIAESASGSLLGHGTLLVGDAVRSTVCGHVERVNKLITVRPSHSRYLGETGDVVVGRVVGVGDQRWQVDLAARQHASLLLASIHLPGGALRRRNAEDALSIRSFYREGDVLACEVQKVRGDGSIALHTRSERYGRRAGGMLVQLPCALVRRCKQHIQAVEGAPGVELVLGCNGWLWIGKQRESGRKRAAAAEEEGGKEEEDEEEAVRAQEAEVVLTRDERERVVRVANCVHVLRERGTAVWNVSIADVLAASLQMGLPAKAMRNPDVIPVLADAAAAIGQRRDRQQQAAEAETERMREDG